MASLKQYKILQEIYKELRPKNYSMKEAFDFIRSCKVLSKNNQQLDSRLNSKTLNMRLKECLREAKKEVKMYG